jgi:hypothetical protein
MGSLRGGLEAQRTPVGLSRCPSPALHRCLPLSLATLVAMRVVGQPEQIEGLVGDGPWGALAGRSEAGMDQCDQRRSVHHGLPLLNHHGWQPCARLRTEPCGTLQPLGALVRLVALWLGLRVVGERCRVPRQSPCLDARWRDTIQQGERKGGGWCKRGEDLVKRGAQGVKQCQPPRVIALFAQAAQARPLCADACDRPEPTTRGTPGEGVAEEREQASTLSVSC